MAVSALLSCLLSTPRAPQAARSRRLRALPEGAARGGDFVRPHLRAMAPYTPILPFDVLSAQLGRAPEDIIKLDANENPYGPPPEVREALANLQFPHIYPDPEVRALRAALAAECGVPAENLVVGAGADEVIDILMRCVLQPGDCVLNAPPTFGMYAFGCQVNDARLLDVPRLPDFSLDEPALLAAAAAQPQPPRLLFLTSPNNPDGGVLPDAQLLRLLAALPRTLLVLDEAYVEFAEAEGGGAAASRVPWVLRHPNLAVLRTFSKRAGLAGLRVGYGAFPADIVPFLMKAKQPYNVAVTAEAAALAALSNPAYLARVRDALVAERRALIQLLQGLPGLEPYASHANFVLVRVAGGAAAAAELRRRLAEEEGIMVRYYSAPAALAGCIRISVGKPEHTEALGRALRRMLAAE